VGEVSPWEGPAQAWVARLMLPEAHGPQATPPWLLVSYGPASCICDLPASCDFQAPPCKPDVGGRWGSGCVLAPWGPWASGGGVLSSRPAREGGGDRLTAAGQLGQQETAVATSPGHPGATTLSSLTVASLPASGREQSNCSVTGMCEDSHG
jgi:hypothetical protein